MSERQQVFVIFKPDCLKRGLSARLVSAINGANLSIERYKVVALNEDFLEVVYGNLLGEHFYKDLRDFMISGPSIVMLIGGTSAVETMNRLKHEIRKENSAGWIDLTEEDLGLWKLGKHPHQHALNIKLVAANLIHVCDSESESIKCAETILYT